MQNVYHNPPQLKHFDFLPTLDDLEFIPEGSGMRIRIPKYKVELALDKALDKALDNDLHPDTRVEESDLTASFVVTTRYSVSPPFPLLWLTTY